MPRPDIYKVDVYLVPEVSLIFQKITVVDRRASSTALKYEEELIEL